MRNTYSSEICEFNTDHNDYELLWVKVKHCKLNYAVGAIYHPPNPVYNNNDFLNFIDRTVEELSIECNFVILARDLNSLSLLTISEHAGLINVVHAPTRGSSFLDHVLVSAEIYEHVKIVKALANSDHQAIVVYNGPPKQNLNKLRIVSTYRKKTPSVNASYLTHLSTLNSSDFVLDSPFNTQHAFDHFYAVAINLLNLY